MRWGIGQPKLESQILVCPVLGYYTSKPLGVLIYRDVMKSHFKIDAAKAASSQHLPEAVLQVGGSESIHYSAAVDHSKVSTKLVGLLRLGGAVVSPFYQYDSVQKRALLGLP